MRTKCIMKIDAQQFHEKQILAEKTYTVCIMGYLFGPIPISLVHGKKKKATLKLPFSFPNQSYVLRFLAFLQNGNWYRHAMNENGKWNKNVWLNSSANDVPWNAAGAGHGLAGLSLRGRLEEAAVGSRVVRVCLRGLSWSNFPWHKNTIQNW